MQLPTNPGECQVSWPGWREGLGYTIRREGRGDWERGVYHYIHVLHTRGRGMYFTPGEGHVLYTRGRGMYQCITLEGGS